MSGAIIVVDKIFFPIMSVVTIHFLIFSIQALSSFFQCFCPLDVCVHTYTCEIVITTLMDVHRNTDL